MPARRKTSPVVWVLVFVLGIFVLAGVAFVGAGFFVVHKARQAGIDPELWSRNPGLAVGKLIAAGNPDVEVVRTDDEAGTVTIRDRRNGKVMTFSFDDIRNGKFKMTARDDEGKTATVEAGAGATVPSWIPQYPGTSNTPGFAAKGESDDGAGEAGSYVFVTQDSPRRVASFFEEKARELGMKQTVAMQADAGGTLVLADDEHDRTLTIVIGRGSEGTTVNVTYSRKR